MTEGAAKIHWGEITHWQAIPAPGGPGLGYRVSGRFDVERSRSLGRAGPAYGHTSLVLAHDVETGEVETLNSRYTLVGLPTIDRCPLGKEAQMALDVAKLTG